MKRKPTLLFFLCLVILVAANSAVFFHVHTNRADEPEAQVVLTERELRLPWTNNRENNGLSLHLDWRTYSSDGGYIGTGSGSPSWLDRAKLRSLGFHVGEIDQRKENDIYRPRPLPKDVLLVLEVDSDLHERVIEAKEQAVQKTRAELEREPENESLQWAVKNSEQELAAEKTGRSRLYVVDAGLDGDRLRSKYTDRQKYIITPGSVRIHYTSNNGEIAGWITGLQVENIHVPLALKQQIETIAVIEKGYGSDTEPPRFTAKLAFGRKFEPWLLAVEEFE